MFFFLILKRLEVGFYANVLLQQIVAVFGILFLELDFDLKLKLLSKTLFKFDLGKNLKNVVWQCFDIINAKKTIIFLKNVWNFAGKMQWNMVGGL